MTAKQAAEYLGPYGRVAYGLVNEKAHYTIEQRGAWITAWCMTGLRPGRDGRVKMKPLRSVIGQEMLDFLVSEGDLCVTDDPELLRFRNFEWANEPMEKNRRNVAAYRERQRATENGARPVDIVPSGNGKITDDVGSHSHSLDTYPEGDEPPSVGSPLPGPDDPPDALDRYHELTQAMPWSTRAGSWLRELQSAHGIVHVVAALEVEHKADQSMKTLLSRVQARLERQKDRVDRAERAKPKPVDPLQAQIRAAIAEDPEPEIDTSPEAIAAGKAAWESMRGGLASAVGSAVRSGSGDRVGAQASTRRNGGNVGSQRPPRPAPSDLRGATERSVQPRDGRPTTQAPTDGA